MSKKMVSIIIAVFNDVDNIRYCIDSVLRQKNVNFELIIIDGNSSDGTVNVLQSYKKNNLKWISEKDNGIYDAWNKAIKMSEGEWFSFLGADDTWATSDSLFELVNLAKYPNITFVSGRNCMVDSAGRKGRSYGDKWCFHEMKKRMTIAHVGALHHRSLFEKNGLFDTSYFIAGDYEFLLRANSDIIGSYAPIDVVFMGDEGVSRMQPLLVFSEGCRALTNTANIGYLYGWVFYINSIVKYFIRALMKKVLQ